MYNDTQKGQTWTKKDNKSWPRSWVSTSETQTLFEKKVEKERKEIWIKEEKGGEREERRESGKEGKSS